MTEARVRGCGRGQNANSPGIRNGRTGIQEEECLCALYDASASSAGRGRTQRRQGSAKVAKEYGKNNIFSLFAMSLRLYLGEAERKGAKDPLRAQKNTARIISLRSLRRLCVSALFDICLTDPNDEDTGVF